MQTLRFLAATALLSSATLATGSPAFAQPGGPGGWTSDPWRSPAPGRSSSLSSRRGSDARVGKVNVATFVTQGDAAKALGHGPVDVSALLNGDPNSIEGPTYEAAIVSELVSAGYDTAHPEGAIGQSAALRVTTSVVEPAEGKRNPVSGEAMVGVSNRGTSTGLALNFDFSKPRGALLSTRFDLRILDQASGETLWEGRADIVTRDGDDDWTDQDVATRLARELFRRFPQGTSIEAYGP